MGASTKTNPQIEGQISKYEIRYPQCRDLYYKEVEACELLSHHSLLMDLDRRFQSSEFAH